MKSSFESRTLEYKKIKIYGYDLALAHISVDGITSWRCRAVPTTGVFTALTKTKDWPEERYTGMDHFEWCLIMENPFPAERVTT